jgi:hypothetical protein
LKLPVEGYGGVVGDAVTAILGNTYGVGGALLVRCWNDVTVKMTSITSVIAIISSSGNLRNECTIQSL